MDTSNNAKILLAEKCVRDVDRLIGNIREIKREGITKLISAKIMEIKYSYGEPEDLVPYFSELKKMCSRIIEVLGAERWHQRLKEMKISELNIAHIRFCLNILYNLDTRINLPDDPAYAVDIRIGEIKSVMKHPRADKLKVCNVNVGRVVTVVTNIHDVKENEKLAVALLPPTEFFGVVSEGMFASHNIKDGNPGALPELTEEELNSIRKEVLLYLRG